jgi:phosphoglucosamine mutase
LSPKLFGTDGMRGVAYEPPLDRVTLGRLGSALAAHLHEAGLPVEILLAGDTRESTPALAEWLGGAFIAAGGGVEWAGVLPTPAVSHLVRDHDGFGAGVILSASHNPAADNGVKLVNGSGTKWPVDEERRLEERLATVQGDADLAPLPSVQAVWQERYIDLLLRSLTGQPLEGMHLVVDPANGAAAPVATPFFSRLGARVEVINCAPDGRNINLRCGALHPRTLAARVVEQGADAGVAFDGDADRAVLITAAGRVLDGDDLLLIWAKELAGADLLPDRKVVATVMSNLGLGAALARDGIELVRCPVGDREVRTAMEQGGIALGGEQSGHVICSHFAATGDGLLTAAHVLAIGARTGQPLERLATLRRFPQVLLNVRVGERRPIGEVPSLAHAVAEAETALAGSGRVFVRYSGTEPLLRIMVEAATADEAQQTAERIAALAREHLGAV